jgi:uncharacterized RDD family membrane protein YckC
MPERDASGQSGGSTEQSARPGEWGPPDQGSVPSQGGAPSQGSAPGQGSVPGQDQHAGGGYGSIPAQPEAGPAGGQWASQPGAWGRQPGSMTPVNEAETRVTWRRIFQYWIDAFFVSVVPYLVSIPFDRSSSLIMHVIGGVLFVVLFVLIGLWYWVIRPHSHNGQTFAMKWFGVRVISKDGGPATLTQLFARWISLLLDSAPWMWPFTGLLGLIVMLCSRYRQRIGDHLARTLVIRTASHIYGGPGAPSEYGQSGTVQSGTVESGTVQSGQGTGQQTSAEQTGVSRPPAGNA